MIACDSYIDDNNYIQVPDSWLDEDSFTVSMDLDTETWVAFHDYIPDFSISLRDTRVLHFYNYGLYQLNVGNPCTYFGKLFDWYVTPVVVLRLQDNDNRLQVFILRSLGLSADIENNKIRLLDKTFTSISLHNSFQGTQERLLIPFDTECSLLEQYGKFNIRRLGKRWSYNYAFNEKDSSLERTYKEELDDFIVLNTKDKKCTMEELYRSRLIDDHLIIKLTHNNAEGNRLYLYDIVVEVDISQ